MNLDKLQEAHPYNIGFKNSLNNFLFLSAFIAIFVFIFRSHQIFPEVGSGNWMFIPSARVWLLWLQLIPTSYYLNLSSQVKQKTVGRTGMKSSTMS